jgi:PAS domain S-box-containing protein
VCNSIAGVADHLAAVELLDLPDSESRPFSSPNRHSVSGTNSTAESRMPAILEASDDAIIEQTLDGTITSWSKGAERAYGYSAAEIVGRSIAVLYPHGSLAELPVTLAHVAEGERIDRLGNVRLRNGDEVTGSSTVVPITRAMRLSGPRS